MSGEMKAEILDELGTALSAQVEKAAGAVIASHQAEFDVMFDAFICALLAAAITVWAAKRDQQRARAGE